MNNKTEELHLLIDQVTNPLNEDFEVSKFDEFCYVVKADSTLCSAAIKYLALKIQSKNTKECMLTLDVLEESMDCLGSNFQIEVNKFKFLNEMIRLVSKKFLGDTTPREIQDRILDILFTWTDKYPELSKIREAYTMLLSQGISHQPQKNVILSGNKRTSDSTLKVMESEKFKRLLQSKNQKDIIAANLMIQNMVRVEDRKIQIQNRRLNDLQSAYENSILLKEMLEEYNHAHASEDTATTLREIYENCVKLKPTVSRLAEESPESEALLNKILETSDAINTAIDLYTAIIVNHNRMPDERENNEGASVNLLDVEVKTAGKNDTDLSALNDIFSTPATLAATTSSILLTPHVVPSRTPQKIVPDENLFIDVDPLPPAQIINSNSSAVVAKPTSKGPLSELDSIVSGIKTKLLGDSEKATSNKMDFSHELCDDFENDLIQNDSNKEELPAENNEIVTATVPEPERKVALKDINLDINVIQPSEIEEPRTILDENNGLKVLVNFTKDRPAKDVIVLVITVVNQGAVGINNFQFDASVTKPCKLRIMEASGKELPGVKKFKPPTETINQVLLLFNPTQLPVNMIAILTYNIQDDPDPYKESIEVKNIPYTS